MSKKLWEMDPQELIDFAKSNEIGELGQVELLKSLVTTGQSTIDVKGHDQRGIQDEEGIGDLPSDERNPNVEGKTSKRNASKYNKGSETLNDDADVKNPQDEDEDGVEGEDEEQDDTEDDPRVRNNAGPSRQGNVMQSRSSKKANKSYARAIEEHEDEFVQDIFAKSRNPDELSELVDGTAFLRPMTDAIANALAKSVVAIESLEDRLAKSEDASNELVRLVKSQSARIKSLETSVIEVAKSRSADTDESETVQKSNVAQGAMAVLRNTEKVAKGKGHLPLTGNYNEDSQVVMQVLEKAANSGKSGAMKMLTKMNAIPANELADFASKIPTDWEL